MHGRVAGTRRGEIGQRVGVKTARCTGGPSEVQQTQVAGCCTPARSHVASMSADFPILDSIVLVVIVEGAMREPIARHLLEQACYGVAITLEWAMTGTGRAASRPFHFVSLRLLFLLSAAATVGPLRLLLPLTPA